MIAAERETVAVGTAADEEVVISSSQRKHITKLRKHPAFTEVHSEMIGNTEYAVFTVPADDWNPATGGKRKRVMTEEQKRIAGERLQAALREKNGG